MNDEPIRAALAELVTCKDLKTRFEAMDGGGYIQEGAFIPVNEEYFRLLAEYECRQPLAWEAARLALTAGSAEPRRVRVWWKTGPEGEFMMSPAFEGDTEHMTADDWRPTYDGPATSPTELEIRSEYANHIDPEVWALAGEVAAKLDRAATVMPARRVCACCGGSGYED